MAGLQFDLVPRACVKMRSSISSTSSIAHAVAVLVFE